MSIETASDSEAYLKSVLKTLERNPSSLKTYGTYNVGYLTGLDWGYIRPDVEFTEQEEKLIQLSRSCLSKTNSLTILGLGEMVGYGLVKVASAFRDEISTGSVRVIATNLEEDFEIKRAIDEAKRRLAIFGSLSNYRFLREIAPNGSTEMQILTQNRPILNNPQEIEFLESHHYLVNYLSGIEILNTPNALRAINLDEANIIHENMGAIRHTSNRYHALSIIPDICHTSMEFY